MKSLYASTSRAEKTDEVVLKVVNISRSELPTDIKLNGTTGVCRPAKAVVLTCENASDENSLAEPTKVAPVAGTVDVNGRDFRHVFPGNSVTVLLLPTN